MMLRLNHTFPILSVRFILTLIFCFCSLFISAQEEITEERKQPNAVVLGFGVLPKHHEEKFLLAVELSYMYKINEIIAIGSGAGIHFTKEPFYVIAFRGDVEIYRGLGGGILIGTAIQEEEVSLMAGLELGYGFNLKSITMGPVIELSYHHKHEHFMIGLQAAYHF